MLRSLKPEEFKENRAGNCLEPQVLFDRSGQRFLARCRDCKKCQKDSVTRWVGKCVLEALASEKTVALTLTYNDDYFENSQVVPKADVQNMIKRLRADGHRVRYFIVSEFGSKKGRGHWHCLLFFSYENPSKPLELPPVETEKQHWKYWCSDRRHGRVNPLGFVFVQKPDQHGVAYVLKYIQKSSAEASFRRPMRSLKPALGTFGLPVIAKQMVKAGLPFSHVYTIENVTFRNGNLIRFSVVGSMLRDLWLEYKKAWAAKHGYASAPPLADKTAKVFRKTFFSPALRRWEEEELSRRMWLDVRDHFDRQIWLDKTALVRLTSTQDYFWFHVLENEKDTKVLIWRVERAAEIIAFLRGYRVGTPVVAPYGRAPF